MEALALVNVALEACTALAKVRELATLGIQAPVAEPILLDISNLLTRHDSVVMPVMSSKSVLSSGNRQEDAIASTNVSSASVPRWLRRNGEGDEASATILIDDGRCDSDRQMLVEPTRQLNP